MAGFLGGVVDDFGSEVEVAAASEPAAAPVIVRQVVSLWSAVCIGAFLRLVAVAGSWWGGTASFPR